MRGEILDHFERRRRWSDEQKLAIVTEVGVGGASVTQVAQRHEITRQQVYAWRHELKRKGLLQSGGEALFLPVDVRAAIAAEETAPATEAVPAHVEIVLRNGRQLRVPGGIGEMTLRRLIRLVGRSSPSAAGAATD